MKRTLTLVAVFASTLAFGQRQATPTEQQRCAEQAQKKFHDDGWDSRSTPYGYISHYDSRTNVCFMRLLSIKLNDKDEPGSLSVKVVDAFGGQEHAAYIGDLREKVSNCEVTPLGHDRIECKSYVEFDDLLGKHFGFFGVAK